MNARSTHDELERRLRAAAVSAPRPPTVLRERILAAVRAAPRVPETTTVGAARAARGARWGNVLAAAAALFALASAWWLARVTPEPARDPRAVVALSQDLLGQGARMLAFPARAEADLRVEAERLLADTARIAEDVVRGLPAPLRPPRGRM